MRYYLVIPVLISILISCTPQSDYTVPGEIIIAGQIIDYELDPSKEILTIYVNDNGQADQLSYPTKIDSSGNFKIKFERYYPQDVMVSFKTNFRVIVHPGDSLYVEFDGSTNKRTEIFETIKFSGNSAKSNEQLSNYLLGYFKNRPSSKFIHQNEKILDPEDYILFQDSIKLSRELRRDLFINSFSPNVEVVQWINSSILLDYCDQLLQYPGQHRNYNKLPWEWTVDKNYWHFLNTTPILNIESLIYADSRWFINQYLNGYIWSIAWRNADSISKANPDSLIIQKILDLSRKEQLLKQLTLNEFINTSFSKYDVSIFEEYREELNEIISENFLLEPIEKRYVEIKTFLEQPVLAKDIVVNSINDNSASDLLSKILTDGKDKVIYIDCWATWCGPCIAEIPHSKAMMKEFREQNVEFVFICLNSEEEKWKSVLAEKQLGGKHYLLNDTQGAYFKELFGIHGFPTYVIIDQVGNIIKSGSEFRPSHEATKRIIDEILKNNVMPNA